MSYKSHPGYLDFPGGGNLKGEQPIRTAQRELQEETGMVVDRNDLTYMETLKENKKDIHIYSFFTAKHPSKQFPSREHEDFIFLRANEVKNYKVVPGTKRLIKKALGKFLL
jgi:8-oxo-dGTP pyrophosphatase MutT (NUDIX family)